MDISLVLIIVFHSHIPYGMGDDEIEQLYSVKLKPFITALNNFPKIQVVLHYSGVLFQWLDKVHPEYISLVKDLIARKQVELLGGAFYEPLLPLLPLTDKLGQIELMTTYIRKKFGKRPQGCWLPGLAWDQSLAQVLYNSGMGYTFLREEQFVRADLSGEAPYTPCITEAQGKIITVFPISHRLAGDFSQGKLTGALECLAREIPPGERRVVSVFPEQWIVKGTGARKNEEGLSRLFEELSQCGSFVDFNIPAKLYKSRAGLPKAYFPDSFEGEPAEDPANGGTEPRIDFYPRRFLITYPEANGIYAKMMFINMLINQLRGDKSRKLSARKSLWKAQGQDSFYRTQGGGIYRNTIRNAAYRELLEAERITRENGVFSPSLMVMDFDIDGEDEYLFQDEHINCYVKTMGAGLFEFDYLPKTWNYLAVMESRGAGGLRTGFADFLAPPHFPPEALTENPQAFSGRRCASERYEVLEVDKVHKKVCFRLSPVPELYYGSVKIEKTYHLAKGVLSVKYLLTNQSDKKMRFNFIPRLDLAFPGEGENYQRVMKAGAGLPLAEGAVLDTPGLEFQDIRNEVSLTLESDRNFDAYIKPRRVSCPVHGKETALYQSTCVLPVNAVSLGPNVSWETEYRITLAHR
jgi:hypothetical protein